MDSVEHPRLKLETRLATYADVSAITAIYNQGIADRIATLEMRLREIPEMEAWLGNRSPRHPVLVCVSSQKIVGWAALNVFNFRECYRNVADISIYVDREFRNRGVGSVLLTALIQTARAMEYYKLVLTMLAHNHTGHYLYKKFHFQEVGIYRKHGLLDGQWVDMRIMELFIGV